MFIIMIPTYVQISIVKLILKLLRRFGVITPSSGSLQVVSANVMNYQNDKIQYNSVSLC